MERNDAGKDWRLDTWKEIGSFFGRDERTVKRWEVSRGLPVHRVPGKRGSVYAYARELEGWLRSADSALDDARQQPQISANEEIFSEIQADASDPDGDVDMPQVPTVIGQVELEPVLEAPRTPKRSYVFASLLALAMAFAIPAAVTLHLRAVGTRGELRQHVADPEAQEFYLKGEYYLQKRTAESLNQAVDNFTQAIVRDPAYAQAYAGLANCYNLMREYTLMPASEAYPRALAAAKQAVALDDTLSGAHSSLGFVDFYWLWDVNGAESQFQRAILLDPNSVTAHHWYATFLFHLGRYQDALAEINHAQVLDPSSISILADKGLLLAYAGHVEQGVALLLQLEAADPAFLSPYSYLAGIYLTTGKYQASLEQSQQAATLMHDKDRLSVVEAGEEGFRRGGTDGMFKAELSQQTTLYDAGRLSAFSIADTYSRLGKKQEAIAYLQISCKRHEPELSGLRVDRGLQTLHDDPEYRQLLAEVGFPPRQD